MIKLIFIYKTMNGSLIILLVLIGTLIDCQDQHNQTTNQDGIKDAVPINDTLNVNATGIGNEQPIQINTTDNMNIIADVNGRNDNTTVTENTTVNGTQTLQENVTNESVVNNMENKTTTNNVVDEIQPPVVDNVDKWDYFNLTLETEKYFNTQYEDTEEDETIKEAEEVGQKEHVEVEDTEEARLKREWEAQVSNFIASDILTLKVRGKKSEFFYFDIQKVPSILKVAYIVNNENLPIDFMVINPKNKFIHKTNSKSQIYVELTADIPGTYKFVLDNAWWSLKKKVSFAIHTGNNTDSNLETKNMDKITEKITLALKKVKDVKLQQNLIVKKYEGHYETTKSHNKQILKYSIIECITMVIILFVQLFYLKNLLNKIS